MTATVLVTGGAGYVGSHACKALAGAGYTPVVYDNLALGHRDFVKWGPLVTGDIADRKRLDRALRKYRPQAVMHFAALISVGESVDNPALYYRNNVAGTLTLLEAVAAGGIGAFVFSSSAAVYGTPSTVPIPEDHPFDPVSPYGANKAMVERMLRDMEAPAGIRSVALRYFNAAGADADGELGEEHEPETHLIPLVIDAALGKRRHIEIYGTDYDTPDGTAVRDYVHVADLADAHVRALGHLLDGGPSLALNLGTGRGNSVREVIAAVEAVSGRPVPVREGPRRPGDPPALVADPARARDILGWRPQFDSLDAIVETAWRWHAGGRGKDAA